MFTSLTHRLAMNALSLLNQNTSSSDPYAKTEVITPEIAQAFLDNTKIRNRTSRRDVLMLTQKHYVKENGKLLSLSQSAATVTY